MSRCDPRCRDVAGSDCRDPRFAVNRSLQPVQNWRSEFAACVPSEATVCHRRCCTELGGSISVRFDAVAYHRWLLPPKLSGEPEERCAARPIRSMTSAQIPRLVEFQTHSVFAAYGHWSHQIPQVAATSGQTRVVRSRWLREARHHLALAQPKLGSSRHSGAELRRPNTLLQSTC